MIDKNVIFVRLDNIVKTINQTFNCEITTTSNKLKATMSHDNTPNLMTKDKMFFSIQ